MSSVQDRVRVTLFEVVDAVAAFMEMVGRGGCV
jgi:hypothetical protein